MDNIIKRLIGENTTCGFKEFLERKHFKSWLKSVGAFANGLGGSLFFCVNDDAKDSREYQGNLLSLLDAGEQFVDLHNLKVTLALQYSHHKFERMDKIAEPPPEHS